MGTREKEKMKNGLKLTKDETDRKKGRSWKEGELRRVWRVWWWHTVGSLSMLLFSFYSIIF